MIAAVLAAPALAEDILGVRNDGSIVTVDASNPAMAKTTVAVIGLRQGELILGADFSPADGSLYVIGNTGRLYRVDRDSGLATSISGAAFAPPLDGTDFGLTFDLSGAALRLTSDTGQNLVIDVGTGAVLSSDPRLTYAAGDVNVGATAGVTACGWMTSAQSGAVLYGIDLARGLLVRIDSPEAGSVRTVGSLGLTGLVANGYTGFDISASTGHAFAVLDAQNDSVSRLFLVDLATGGAQQVGSPMTSLMRGAAVVPAAPPAPAGTLFAGLVNAADVVTFAVDAPQTVRSTVHVKGLPAGDSLLGISVRPTTGILFGITRTALWDIDLLGGTAARIGDGFSQPLPAGVLACDFDPATDRIRVVGGASVNLTIDPNTGALVDTDPFTGGLQTDAALTYAPGDPHGPGAPSVHAIAFTGRAQPGTSSRCYVLEDNAATVARLGTIALAPNEARDGRVSTIGPLAIEDVATLPPSLGLVTTGNSTGYAVLQTSTTASTLYHVDLTTGIASIVGDVGGSAPLRALTVQPTVSPPRVYVKKLTMGLDFRRTGRDSLTLRGSTPFPAGALEGLVVTLDIDGYTKLFTLDAKGRGKDGKDVLRLAGNSSHGIGLKVTLTKESLVAALLDAGMDGSVFARRSPRQIVVSVSFGGKTYRTPVDVLYSARPGKSGSATTL